MDPVDRSELDGFSEACDARVAKDRALDPFCSRTAWQLSYHDAFAPERPLYFGCRGDDHVLLAESENEQLGRFLTPLEDMWGFGSPLVGDGAGALLSGLLNDTPKPVLLLGLPADRNRLARSFADLRDRYSLFGIPPVVRRIASLHGGIDAWGSRRTPAFRRNLRAAARRVEAAGIRIHRVDLEYDTDLSCVYERVLDVERRSWKGLAGRGADADPMQSFYAGLWPRLRARGELRVLLAERAGDAVGYLHGGRVGDHFRGLQVSFDADERALGLGNVLQFRMLEWSCETGATTYDLGAYSDYKSRWAEPGLTTLGLLLRPKDA